MIKIPSSNGMRIILILLFLFVAPTSAFAWDPTGAKGAVRELERVLDELFSDLTAERVAINENLRDRIGQISSEAQALTREIDAVIASNVDRLDASVEERLDQLFVESTSLILMASGEIKSIIRLASCESSSLIQQFEDAVDRQFSISLFRSPPLEAGDKFLVYQEVQLRRLRRLKERAAIDEIVLLYGDLSRAAAFALCLQNINTASVQILNSKIDQYSERGHIWTWLLLE